MGQPIFNNLHRPNHVRETKASHRLFADGDAPVVKGMAVVKRAHVRVDGVVVRLQRPSAQGRLASTRPKLVLKRKSNVNALTRLHHLSP